MKNILFLYLIFTLQLLFIINSISANNKNLAYAKETKRKITYKLKVNKEVFNKEYIDVTLDTEYYAKCLEYPHKFFINKFLDKNKTYIELKNIEKCKFRKYRIEKFIKKIYNSSPMWKEQIANCLNITIAELKNLKTTSPRTKIDFIFKCEDYIAKQNYDPEYYSHKRAKEKLKNYRDKIQKQYLASFKFLISESSSKIFLPKLTACYKNKKARNNKSCLEKIDQLALNGAKPIMDYNDKKEIASHIDYNYYFAISNCVMPQYYKYQKKNTINNKDSFIKFLAILSENRKIKKNIYLIKIFNKCIKKIENRLK